MTSQQAVEQLQEELEKLVPYACEARPHDYGNAVLVIVNIPGRTEPFTVRRPLSGLQSDSDIRVQAENIQDEVAVAARGP